MVTSGTAGAFRLSCPYWCVETSSLARTSYCRLEKQAQSQRCEEPYEGDRWSATQSKIAAALSKLAKDEGDVETYEINEGAVRNPVLSLQAISAIPRLRLLVRSLEHLRNEAGPGSTSTRFRAF